MKRDLVIAGLALAAVVAIGIPSMIRSLTPSIDAEIRRTIRELHAARSSGGQAHNIAFDESGRPMGKAELEKPDYTIAIDGDGRVSVRVR